MLTPKNMSEKYAGFTQSVQKAKWHEARIVDAANEPYKENKLKK